jgi:hypothetical protein
MHGMILRLLDQQATNSAGQHHRRQCNTSDLKNGFLRWGHSGSGMIAKRTVHDPAHQLAGPGVSVGQDRSRPPGGARGVAEPPPANMLNPLRRKGPRRSLL